MLPKGELADDDYPSDIEDEIKSLETSGKSIDEELSITYEKIYNKAIGKDKARRKEVVSTALKWVMCAFRSLRVEELALASSVRSEGEMPGDVTKERLMKHCANLLFRDESGYVRFAHMSVSEFLQSKPEYATSKAHAALGICMA
jgi:hypothetical protein